MTSQQDVLISTASGSIDETLYIAQKMYNERLCFGMWAHSLLTKDGVAIAASVLGDEILVRVYGHEENTYEEDTWCFATRALVEACFYKLKRAVPTMTSEEVLDGYVRHNDPIFRIGLGEVNSKVVPGLSWKTVACLNM